MNSCRFYHTTQYLFCYILYSFANKSFNTKTAPNPKILMIQPISWVYWYSNCIITSKKHQKSKYLFISGYIKIFKLSIKSYTLIKIPGLKSNVETHKWLFKYHRFSVIMKNTLTSIFFIFNFHYWKNSMESN